MKNVMRYCVLLMTILIFGNTYMEMPRIDWRFMDEN